MSFYISSSLHWTMKRTVSQPWRGGIAHFRFDKKTKCDKHYLSPPLCKNVYRRPNTIDSPVENQHPVKRRPIHGLTFKAFRAEKAKILVLCKAKTVLDFMVWILDSRYWIPCSVSVEHGFRIPIVSRILYRWISWITDSNPQDSAFHNQKFIGFRNPYNLKRGE